MAKSAYSEKSEGGPQKFHVKSTPRIGEVAVSGGIIAGALIFFLQKKDFAESFAIVLLCSGIVFVAGLLEDLTKKISPGVRLLFCIIFALLAFLLMQNCPGLI